MRLNTASFANFFENGGRIVGIHNLILRRTESSAQEDPKVLEISGFQYNCDHDFDHNRGQILRRENGQFFELSSLHFQRRMYISV